MSIYSTAEYLNLPRSPETWLIDPLLPIGGSALLYGDAKIGKSFAALQLASDLSTGANWLGFQCRSSRVVYVQLDTPRSLWASRIEGLLQVDKRPHLSDSKSNSKIYVPVAQSLQPESQGLSQILWADRETLNTWPFDILNDEHQVLLKSVLDPLAPDVVIVDTLREAHSGDENDSTAMQQVIARLTAAVKPAAVILISHSRKTNPEFGADLINDNRGSNYVVGRMDAIIRFSWSTIRVSGRAIDEQSIGVHRADNGFWELSEDPLKKLADNLLLDDSMSVREMARLLHDQSGKSESACRAYIRRRKERI
jgi:RecA-family ATPase